MKNSKVPPATFFINEKDCWYNCASHPFPSPDNEVEFSQIHCENNFIIGYHDGKLQYIRLLKKLPAK